MPVNLSLQDWPSLLVLVLVGGIASGINAVAGGGSFISFPTLTGVHLGGLKLGYNMPMREANATNSAGLWPGSLTGAFGFWNLIPKTKHYLKRLWLPTVIGSILGALLLIWSKESVFEKVVPGLILLATILLALQPQIKALANKHKREVSDSGAMLLQFLVAVYGGYFGAGMGIMMLAVFVLYMEGNIHEINAVKAWLAVIINVVCSAVFLSESMIALLPFAALTVGSLIGGYYAARLSQKVDPNKLRIGIACYGFLTAGYFAYTNWLK